MSESITEKQKLYNNLLNAVKEMAEEDIEKLITFIYVEKNGTLQEIADVLGITKQRLQQKYPNLAKSKKEENYE